MFLHEKTYDLDELARFNLHIHTTFSRCAKPEMKVLEIVRTAENAGLEMIALTDHNYIEKKNAVAQQRYDILRQLQEIEPKIKVLVGSELSSYAPNKFFDDISSDKSLDYRLYTTNHYHLNPWIHPDNKTPRGYAEHMMAITRGVISSNRADCIAHPFMAKYIKFFNDFKDVTLSFNDNEIAELLESGDKANVSWEINVPAVLGDPDFHKRLFNIGKEVGVNFNLGTDAHALKNIDTRQFLPELKRILY